MSGKIESFEARISCIKCNWSGEVNKCTRTARTLNGDRDEPVDLKCPKCGEILAAFGWLGFQESVNVRVLDSGNQSINL